MVHPAGPRQQREDAVLSVAGGPHPGHLPGAGAHHVQAVPGEAAVLRAPRSLHVSYIGHRLTGVAVSPDGRTLAVSDDEGEIRLLDAQTLAVTRVLRPPDGWPVGELAFTADGRLLLSADQIPAVGPGARVRLRDVSTGRVALSLAALDAYDVAIAPDGSRIASGAFGGSYFWRRGRAGWRRFRMARTTM